MPKTMPEQNKAPPAAHYSDPASAAVAEVAGQEADTNNELRTKVKDWKKSQRVS